MFAQNIAQIPYQKNTNYSCISMKIPKLNLSGSPLLQKTSVKKNQKRFHQQNIYTDLGPNNNKPIKEYNHITTCLYTHRTEPHSNPINEHNIPNNLVNITIRPHIKWQSNRTTQISCHDPRKQRHSDTITRSRKERQTINICDKPTTRTRNPISIVQCV